MNKNYLKDSWCLSAEPSECLTLQFSVNSAMSSNLALPVSDGPMPTDSPHVISLCCIFSVQIHPPPPPPPQLVQPFAPGSLVLLFPLRVAARAIKQATSQVPTASYKGLGGGYLVSSLCEL